jgi:hypothetical protein
VKPTCFNSFSHLVRRASTTNVWRKPRSIRQACEVPATRDGTTLASEYEPRDDGVTLARVIFGGPTG